MRAFDCQKVSQHLHSRLLFKDWGLQLMTIWTRNNHIRHPWFDNTIKKRKQGHSDREWTTSSDESDGSELRPAKRRRCSPGLEKGLADLSLHHKPPKGHTPFIGNESPRIMEVTPQGEEVSMVDVDGRVGGNSLDKNPVVLPSSVEEPELDIPEIEMKTSSWYELAPDRRWIFSAPSVADLLTRFTFH